MKRNNVHKKKAQVAIQFNWIFVIIAGALILLFFIGIVSKQKDISERGIATEKTLQLDSIFTATEISTGAIQDFYSPLEIEFECEGRASSFFIQGRPRDLPIEVVFAPDKIGGDIQAWALDLSVPFRVTNFLYLTSKRNRNYFVGADPMGVYELLDPQINKEKVQLDDVGSMVDKRDDKVKFIFFNQDSLPSVPSDLDYMANNDVTAINIRDDGTIDFYEKDNLGQFKPLGTSFTITDETLLGAIFTQNKESYECTLRKAFERLILVADVINERRIKLSIDNPPECQAPVIYSQRTNTAEFLDHARDCYAEDLDPDECKELVLKISNVRTDNNLLRLNSCPLLY